MSNQGPIGKTDPRFNRQTKARRQGQQAWRRSMQLSHDNAQYKKEARARAAEALAAKPLFESEEEKRLERSEYLSAYVADHAERGWIRDRMDECANG